MITWDESKRRTNLHKHGIDLATLADVFDFPMNTDANFPVTDADREALLTAAPDSVDDPDTSLVDRSNATLTSGGGVEATLSALRWNRGPQRAATKQPVNARLSPEVVTGFRATGKGWQTRLDAALKEWIAQQPGRTQERR